MTGARILVSGAGGFVAGHIAAGLRSLGHRVCAVDIAFDDAAERRLAGCDLATVDLAGSSPALPAADVVIHGAAVTTSPAALGVMPADHINANMRPLLLMLTHAARVPPRAFVFLSSSGVFDAADGGSGLTDTSAPTAQGPYSAAKRAGEILVPGALGGICQTFCLRLGHIYGPEEAARDSRMKVSLLQGWLDAARAGSVLEVDADDPRRDWTFAPDLGPAIDRLIGSPGRVHPFHLCAPQAVRDSTVVGEIMRHHPAATLRMSPGTGVKPPMVASVMPALNGFAWTTVSDGIARLCRAEVAA